MREHKLLFDINKLSLQDTEPKHTLTKQITKEILMEYGYGVTDSWDIKAPVSKTKKKTIK